MPDSVDSEEPAFEYDVPIDGGSDAVRKARDAALKRLLHFDALDIAERITGTHASQQDASLGGYRPSMRETNMLGFALMHENSARKQIALESMGDTTFTNDIDRYISIIEADGFVKVYEESFIDDKWPEHGIRTETFFIFAHRRDGLLLEFDTHGGTHVNGGKVYYNWLPNPVAEGERRDYRLTSSGSMRGSDKDGWVWCGDHDCREALIFNLNQLRANGTFLPVWRHRPWLALLHYMDWHHQPKPNEPGYHNYSRRITKKKTSKLPFWVRRMIISKKPRRAKK